MLRSLRSFRTLLYERYVQVQTYFLTVSEIRFNLKLTPIFTFLFKLTFLQYYIMYCQPSAWYSKLSCCMSTFLLNSLVSESIRTIGLFISEVSTDYEAEYWQKGNKLELDNSFKNTTKNLHRDVGFWKFFWYLHGTHLYW